MNSETGRTLGYSKYIIEGISSSKSPRDLHRYLFEFNHGHSGWTLGVNQLYEQPQTTAEELLAREIFDALLGTFERLIIEEDFMCLRNSKESSFTWIMDAEVFMCSVNRLDQYSDSKSQQRRINKIKGAVRRECHQVMESLTDEDYRKSLQNALTVCFPQSERTS